MPLHGVVLMKSGGVVGTGLASDPQEVHWMPRHGISDYVGHVDSLIRRSVCDNSCSAVTTSLSKVAL